MGFIGNSFVRQILESIIMNVPRDSMNYESFNLNTQEWEFKPINSTNYLSTDFAKITIKLTNGKVLTLYSYINVDELNTNKIGEFLFKKYPYMNNDINYFDAILYGKFNSD